MTSKLFHLHPCTKLFIYTQKVWFYTGAQRKGKGPGYEVQMLLGVRGPMRRKLTKQGHRTRVYIPYGEKWYEYSIRRLQENPTIGLQIAKAFLMPWTNRP